jgi:hypothetical protein
MLENAKSSCTSEGDAVVVRHPERTVVDGGTTVERVAVGAQRLLIASRVREIANRHDELSGHEHAGLGQERRLEVELFDVDAFYVCLDGPCSESC